MCVRDREGWCVQGFMYERRRTFVEYERTDVGMNVRKCLCEKCCPWERVSLLVNRASKRQEERERERWRRDYVLILLPGIQQNINMSLDIHMPLDINMLICFSPPPQLSTERLSDSSRYLNRRSRSFTTLYQTSRPMYIVRCHGYESFRFLTPVLVSTEIPHWTIENHDTC